MDNKIRRSFRTTKITINDLSPEAQMELENKFMAYQVAKTDAVLAERVAGVSVSNAQIERAKSQIAELSLLQAAATYFDQIAGDRVWIPFRNKEGVITFEGFTERLMRNNMRAQQQLLGNSLAQNSEDSGDNAGELYEDEDDMDPGEAN